MNTLQHSFLVVLWVLIHLSGCSGDDQNHDAEPDSDGDSDVDSDIDADADIDGDADGDLPEDGDIDDVFDADEELDGAFDADDSSSSDAELPRCGDGIVQLELGEECDDGNDDDEDTCSSSCLIRYGCPSFPMDCDLASPTVTEQYMESIDSCSFALVPQGPTAEADRLIDELVERAGAPLGVADVLDDLNRFATDGVTSQTAYRLRNHEFRGFRWNSGDNGVDYWYPQGITGSSDAVDHGLVARKRVLLVSWYHRTESRPTKGVRISIADTTDIDDVDYRHLLLVEPFREGGDADFGPVETDSGGALHAGGIVWYGDKLYVADTTRGLRVFDLSRIFRIPDTDDHDRIGVSGGRMDAHGYRYAVPQLARYTLAEDSCPVRFSFAALDRSVEPPLILTGEYRSDDVGGRLVGWSLAPSSEWLDVRSGEVRGIDAQVAAQTKAQGALRWEGNYYISSSSQYLHYGRLYRTRPGLESRITAWVYGCEDLYYERDTGYVWTAAEHPGDRDVVGIPLLEP